MWRSKKVAERVAHGYVDDISPSQLECLTKFKEWLVRDRIKINPWFNDAYYLKFCRARKFNLSAVISMFKEHLQYRKDVDVDTIIQDFNNDKREEIFQHYQKGYCGIDK